MSPPVELEARPGRAAEREAPHPERHAHSTHPHGGQRAWALRRARRRDVPPVPTRWLIKNTDTFAGFAHAIGTYLAGVTLAHMKGVGLIHRPQPMAHSLAYIFDDFFAMDPRGVVPPVYTPTLAANASSMLVNGHPVRLDVIAGGAATNSSRLGERIGNSPAHTVVWLRKGRSSVPTDCALCNCHTEIRYAGLWLRERFWRAAFPWVAHRKGGATLAASAEVTRVAIHVRRGDVYYLGPKTGRPHPHWVDTAAVLEILRGVRTVLGSLAPPAVEVDLYTETGWLANDTAAFLQLAPAARVHMAADPLSTVDTLIAMARADLLVMGSSGYSLWAGILSCGVKVGIPLHERLPLRHVAYASTITTRHEPFHLRAAAELRLAWAEYSACKRDATCRPSLCAARHVSNPHFWMASGLGVAAAADASAVQWKLGQLFWPEKNAAPAAGPLARGAACRAPADDSAAARGGVARRCSPAMADMWRMCSVSKGRNESIVSLSMLACVRGAWQANLTSFLRARKRLPGYPGFVSAVKSSPKVKK